ncbi:MAG TPA: NAD(P)-binding domain-containing protein [Gammaproteobacteria bacterium]|jgi:predicted dinucleotide-binding enzyme|nr:NAD(P)-binding domain-containing protein [Gammaproteobacteria bacterium]
MHVITLYVRKRLANGLRAALVAVSAILVAGLPVLAGAAEPLKIGIVGAGKMGGTLAELWAKAGHEVMISSRHPEELKAQAQAIGPKAHVGTTREAATFGSVVVIAMPYGKWPEISDEIKGLTVGKTVIDLTNPYPDRDGPMAVQARKETTGIADPKYLPGAHLVRAFNSIIWTNLRDLAHRKGDLVAIPVAGDDAAAVAVTQQLVRDAGFEPVMVGPLAEAKRFDVDTPTYVKVMTAAELRKALGLPAK